MGPGDMKEEVKKFVAKYELTEEDEAKLLATMDKCGNAWSKDLKDLDQSLQRANKPSSLLGVRLREIEALKSFQAQSKGGHLPGCMCATCKESSFARAVGAETGNAEGASLNAAALAAYQVGMDSEGAGGFSEDPDMGQEKTGGKGKGKPLVLPTGDLLDEVRMFCGRFALTDRLSTKVMDTLRKRGEEWRKDLAEMNRDMSKARNPSGLLVVRLGDISKEMNPNQLCFNYRAGTCTWGDKCRWSHDVATGRERMNSQLLLAQGKAGTVSAIPDAPATPGSFGGPATPGSFGGMGQEAFGGSVRSSKVEKLLNRKKRDRSSSSGSRDKKKKRRWD